MTTRRGFLAKLGLLPVLLLPKVVKAEEPKVTAETVGVNAICEIGQRLWVGSSTGELWKSEDQGVTWEQVTVFTTEGPVDHFDIVFGGNIGD